MEPMDEVTHNNGILRADFMHCLSSVAAYPYVPDLPVCYIVLLAAHDDVIVPWIPIIGRNFALRPM